MSISVVVLTHNRPDAVKLTISSLLKQTTKPMEIIVIDDASDPPFKDNSLDPIVNVVNLSQNVGSSRARNIGIKVSNGNYVAFMDDDEIAMKNWVSAIQKGINEKADVLGGPVLPMYKSKPPIWWSEKDLGYFVGVGNNNPSEIWGGNMAFNRYVFEKIGFFDPRIGLGKGKNLKGEDSDIIGRVIKAQLKIMFLPDMCVFHSVNSDRISISYIFKWAYTSGKSQRIARGIGKLAPFLIMKAVFTFFNPFRKLGKSGRVKQVAIMVEQIGAVI